MDTAERALLEATITAAFADVNTDADASLARLGWLELLDAEPRAAVEVVFDALGATNCTATALDDVIAHALGLTPRADLAVLLPQFGGWQPPGHIQGDGAHGLGLATTRAVTASELVVVCAAGADLRVETVPAASVELRAVTGIDAELGLHTARVDARVEPGVSAGIALDRTAWEAAVAIGQRAVAHQIAGASRTMLTLACTHATDRIQFGRRIASFQAVRHRLAEALVAVEALEATLQAAGEEPGALTAALAKATAGRTARTVARHAQQVLAGIGFTTEHPFHRFLKRTMLLDGLFGSTDAVTVDIGRQLIAARRVPTLVDL